MKKFGLIGYPLSHSFSKRYFTNKFAAEEIIDCSYENYPLTDISQLYNLLESVPGLAGINITIPYKESVMPFLTSPDNIVQKIGACNCIKIRDGILYGYNTDVYGFGRSLKSKLDARHNRALILGTGGASKAVKFVLEELGIPYQFVSRSKKNDDNAILGYDSLTPEIVDSCKLIINSTPVGMHPSEHLEPPLPYDLITRHHFLFDLIYNPEITRFLQHGADKNATIQNGYDMLIYQAEKSWEIWNEG